ncbi:MAG: hypothetical protein U1D55_04000 [Phycisphaerae bacterium]
MTSPAVEHAPRLTSGLLRLSIASVLVVIAAIVVGYTQTLRLAGREGVVAMIVGAAIPLVATVAGLVPLIRKSQASGPDRVIAALHGMGLRLGLTFLLGGAAAASGFFALRPLLIWIGIAYVLLLATDTIGLTRLGGAGSAATGTVAGGAPVSTHPGRSA